jgi:hypothetical protein
MDTRWTLDGHSMDTPMDTDRTLQKRRKLKQLIENNKNTCFLSFN